MNKPTLWRRFVNFISGIFRKSSTNKTSIVTQDGVYNSEKYLGSINSLYKHAVFKPMPRKDITKIYDDVWHGKKLFDVEKTHYKFERPSFGQRIIARFGR